MKKFRNYFILIPIFILIGVILFRNCTRSETNSNKGLKNSAQLDVKKSSSSNLLVNAKFSLMNKDSVEAFGLCWSIGENPLITDSVFKQEGSEVEFSLNIAPFLQSGTQYYARAFVVNHAGKVTYSSIVPIFTPVLRNNSDVSAASKIKAHIAKESGISKVSTKLIVFPLGTSTTFDVFQEEASFSVAFDSTYIGQAVTKGICYGEVINPTLAYNRIMDSGSGELFNSKMLNLMANTTYYYRPYIITAKDTLYGKNETLTTLKVDVPVVGAVDLKLAKGKSMFVSNVISHDGGTPISERGVCWSTEKNPTVDDAHSMDSLASGTGRSGAKVVGLTLNTPYYLRAYALNSIGIGYGPVSEIFSPIAQVGDAYGGGIIFYLDETGRHGAVCAPNDQPGVTPWVGAITMCKQLHLNGYSDWELPTKEELDLMYSNLYLSNIGSFSNYYWSSTESDYNDAWYWRMNFGSPYYNFKGNMLNVRAVRHF